jgi:hypothetical protein
MTREMREESLRYLRVITGLTRACAASCPNRNDRHLPADALEDVLPNQEELREVERTVYMA